MRRDALTSFVSAVFLVALFYGYLNFTRRDAGGGFHGRSGADGFGSASVKPAGPVIAGSSGTWIISYTAESAGIATGGGVVLQFWPRAGWSPPQNFDPSFPGYTDAKTTAAKAEIELITDPQSFYARAVVIKGRIKPGQKIIFIYGAPENGAGPAGLAKAGNFAEKGALFLVKTDGDGDNFYLPIKNSPRVDVLGGFPTRLLVTAPSLAVVNEPFRVTVAALDSFGNRSSFYESSLKISGGEQAKIPGEIFMSRNSQGAISFDVRPLTEGVINLGVREAQGTAEEVSNPIAVVSQKPRYGLYWGDIYGRSQMSGAIGGPEDYYAYARDVSRLDVSAITDSDHWGAFPLTDNPKGWRSLKNAANDAYAPGRFVTYVGQEYNVWRQGRYYLLYPGDDAPLISPLDEKTNNPIKLFAATKRLDALVIPDNPVIWDQPVNWAFHNPEIERVGVVSNVRFKRQWLYTGSVGSGSRPGRFLFDALARGRRMGFVLGTGAANGHPGMAEAQAVSSGITGIWAKELTREGIIEALRARRTYVTTGQRIYVEFSINGAFMGENLKLAHPEQERVVQARIIGTAPIALIELIKNGDLLSARRPVGSQSDFYYVEYGTARQGDYYWLCVTQKDGEIAMTSPVWIDLR